jgi:hypothetical protein
VWDTNQVGWAHWQVDGSSGRPDPLVGDDHEPSRWGHRGTQVVELSTGRIACTSVKKLEQISLAADLFEVLPNEGRSSDDL